MAGGIATSFSDQLPGSSRTGVGRMSGARLGAAGKLGAGYSIRPGFSTPRGSRVVPVYLAVLLLLKAMQSLVGFVRPFAMLLPEWFPAEHVLSLLLVLIVCFLIGVAVRTPAGRVIRERIEKSLFERIPGYVLFEVDATTGGQR